MSGRLRCKSSRQLKLLSKFVMGALVLSPFKILQWFIKLPFKIFGFLLGDTDNVARDVKSIRIAYN